MGGSPYWYYVPYEDNKNSALKKLREKEFEAGRYYPVMCDIDFPITDGSKCPGKRHRTIEEAIEDAAEDGTKSILDIHTVSDDDDYGIARIMTEDELLEYFGTLKPDKKTIEDNFDNFIDNIERGQAMCITVYENETPCELFFVGYSFD